MKKLFDNVKLQVPHFTVEIRPTSFLIHFSIKIYKTQFFDIPSVIFFSGNLFGLRRFKGELKLHL